LNEMSDITLKTIADAGVVGAGGAGFPTHVKLSGRADSVILNAAECEPLLHKDKEILRHYTDLVIEGLTAAIRFVGAEKGYVGVKEKYSGAIELLRSKLPSHITIAPLLDVYPAGDEFVLVYDVLGRVIPPGGLPLHVGAVVMNVETAHNVAVSPKLPVTEKFLTVAGAVANPVTIRVPIGAPLSACVEAAGGSTIANANYIVGGVMMGHLEENHQAPVDKTTGGLIVLPDDHIVVRRRRRTQPQMDRIGRSACDQCCFCTELCPRYLLGHPLEPHRAMRSLMFNLVGEANVLGTAFCCECNLCSLYSCPEDLDPKDVCAKNKKRLASEDKRWELPPFNPKRPELHMANRKAPMRRLMLKLGLTGFRNVGPLQKDPLVVDRVGVKLKQHIGAPCEPLVEVGQEVRLGEVIGSPGMTNGKPALGVPVHASIDGTVMEVTNGVIWIQKT